MKIYFLGGENVTHRDAMEINARAFQDADRKNPKVLVFSWARPSFDRSMDKRRILVEYFRSLGASLVDFADYSNSIEDLSENFAESDVVYLTGGQLSVLIERLRKKGVAKLLSEYQGVLIGRSAGALALGKWCLVTSRYSGQPKLVEGLSIVDFSVKVHYRSKKDGLLRQLSNCGKFYGIPMRSALVYREGTLSAIGKVVVFENGNKTDFEADESISYHKNY